MTTLERGGGTGGVMVKTRASGLESLVQEIHNALALTLMALCISCNVCGWRISYFYYAS